MVPYMIKNMVNPTELSDIKIGGYTGDLMERFFYNRITSSYAKNTIYKEAEDAFRNKVDDAGVFGIWQGEYWGKWIIGAARACRYLKDAELEAFIRQAVYNLLEYQDEHGYIGTYKDSLNVFKSKVTETNKCEWNWNIWCRKYTLWGLLEAYMLLKDNHILKSAECFASHLIEELKKNHIKISDTGVLVGLPSCSILKPMTILYELTGNTTYLDFSIDLAMQWEDVSGKKPNLITNAFSGKPLHEWYPNSQKWAKAYEAMSCLDGLLELYRVTGIRKYFEAVKSLYDLLYKYESNIVFSVGYNDIFACASDKINAISEPCDTIHWCRLSYELFCLTGESRYMDIFENAFYNAFLAGICGDAKWGARGVRSSNRHFLAPPQAGMKYNHCCVNNMPRGFLNMAQASVMYNEGGIYVNLFTPSETTIRDAYGRTVKIKIDGDYLQSGIVTVETESMLDKEIALNIRIPQWSINTRINIGETDVSTVKPGFYYKTFIKPGSKMIMKISFDLNPRIVDFPTEPVVFKKEDWQSARWMIENDAVSCVSYESMIKERRSIICAGPVLLSKSIDAGNTREEMFNGSTICGGNYSYRIKPIAKSGNFQCLFKVELTSERCTIQTVMCDYASACKNNNPDEFYFNIYL